MVPAVASSIIWIMLLNPQFGIVNIIIRFFGLQAPGWIADPTWAKPAIILMGLWAMGGTIIIYLAALQDVPIHLVEAAILDGEVEDSDVYVLRVKRQVSLTPLSLDFTARVDLDELNRLLRSED